MASNVLLLSALALTAAAASNEKPLYSSVVSDGHSAEVSNVKKTSRKWLNFPAQQKLHSEKVAAKEERKLTESESALLYDDSFWSTHGPLLGLHPQSTMTLVSTKKFPGTGGSILMFSQNVNGKRVYGGEFKVVLGSYNNVISVNGLPMGEISDIDSFNWEKANASVDESSVLNAINAHYLKENGVAISAFSNHGPEVVWYMKGMTRGVSTTPSLTYYVRGAANSPAAAFDAFVDINTMKVVLYMDHMDKASPFASPIDLDIMVYSEPYSTPSNLYFDTTGPHTYPTSDIETDLLVDNTIYVVNMINSLSDGEYKGWAGSASTPNRVESDLAIANAYFDGWWGIHFGTGYITDDVIVHEWAHGYTQTAADLNYQGESGAMNEAFSDIYGEAVDILNTDTTDVSMRSADVNTCTVGKSGAYADSRWIMGEDVTSTAGVGMRDMYQPECFGDPATTTSGYLMCGESDHNGVHTNSGILNKLFATLVDGGEYNGFVINGIGMTKALNLFWRAEGMLTATSQYIDFGMAMQTVCSTSVGSTLFEPTMTSSAPVASADFLSAQDCDIVFDALDQSGVMNTSAACPNIECEPSSDTCEYNSCTVTDHDTVTTYDVSHLIVVYSVLLMVYSI